jgi:hypothetical protein
MPVRAPRAIHAALRAGARKERVTLAEYLSRLATPERLALVEAEAGKLVGSTFINPRPGDASVVQDVASRLGRRQWDVWMALHTIAMRESEG